MFKKIRAWLADLWQSAKDKYEEVKDRVAEKLQ